VKGILIDSDILVEVSRGRDRVILSRWEDLARRETALFCSPVTIAEIWHGSRPHEHTALNALFAALVPISIDGEIGRLAGEFLREFSRSHHVELGDAFIAATAMARDLSLWTRNRKHYPMEGLIFY
jgi:predicted nucleic acid-binding protein